MRTLAALIITALSADLAVGEEVPPNKHQTPSAAKRTKNKETVPAEMLEFFRHAIFLRRLLSTT